MSLRRKLSRIVGVLLESADVVPTPEPEEGWSEAADAGWSAPGTFEISPARTSQVVEAELVSFGESEIEKLRRHNAEYFSVIERIERERNEWITMYREQSAEHLTAQGMLERDLMAVRQTAQRAILMLNVLRKEKGEPPIKGTADLLPYDGEPVGLMERYAERMLELRAQLAAPIDGLAERDAIRAKYQADGAPLDPTDATEDTPSH